MQPVHPFRPRDSATSCAVSATRSAMRSLSPSAMNAAHRAKNLSGCHRSVASRYAAFRSAAVGLRPSDRGFCRSGNGMSLCEKTRSRAREAWPPSAARVGEPYQPHLLAPGRPVHGLELCPRLPLGCHAAREPAVALQLLALDGHLVVVQLAREVVPGLVQLLAHVLAALAHPVLPPLVCARARARASGGAAPGGAGGGGGGGGCGGAAHCLGSTGSAPSACCWPAARTAAVCRAGGPCP